MIEVNEASLKSGLERVLPSDFPASIDRVAVEPGGRICLFGSARRDAIPAFLRKRGVELNVKNTILLKLIPKNADFFAAVRLAFDAGRIDIVPEALELDGHEIKTDDVPRELMDEMSRGVHDLLLAYSPAPRSAAFVRGAVLIAE